MCGSCSVLRTCHLYWYYIEGLIVGKETAQFLELVTCIDIILKGWFGRGSCSVLRTCHLYWYYNKGLILCEETAQFLGLVNCTDITINGWFWVRKLLSSQDLSLVLILHWRVNFGRGNCLPTGLKTYQKYWYYIKGLILCAEAAQFLGLVTCTDITLNGWFSVRKLLIYKNMSFVLILH